MFFTKLLCMAALSFAVNSSTNTSSTIGECIVRNASIVPNSTNTAMFNYLGLECENIFNTNNTNAQYFLIKYNPAFKNDSIMTKSKSTSSSINDCILEDFSIIPNIPNKAMFTYSNCNESAFNTTGQYSLAKFDPIYEKLLLAMGIMTPFLCDTARKISLTIFSCCCDWAKYIQHMSESEVFNTGCNLEKVLSSQWTTMIINSLGVFSIADGVGYKSLAFVPLLLWVLLRFGQDIHYVVNYCRCDSNITHLNKLMNELITQKNNFQCNIDQNNPITQFNDKLQKAIKINSELKYLFELFINRGKIRELYADFNFSQMLDAGVQGDFLQNAINNLKDVKPGDDDMRSKLNDALTHQGQANRLHDALQVVLHPVGEQNQVDQQHVQAVGQNNGAQQHVQAAVQNHGAQQPV